MAGNKRTMMMPLVGGVDRISDLCDDLLLHVLRFLDDDARDVVRTSALSTRWRSLWTRAPVLRLRNHKDAGTNADNTRFNEFVDSVLARRGGGADIDRLELHARLWPGKSRVDAWFHHAMRHTMGSLEFDVPSPPPTMAMMMGLMLAKDRWRAGRGVDLPTTTKVTKMSLVLNHATLLLPPTVEFHRLTELTLKSIEFSDDDDGPLLGHLLSSPSCCPRLRKLTLTNLLGLHDLRLDGGALETLHLSNLQVKRLLHVDAPRLSVLHTQNFFMPCDHSSLTVQAPALEKLEASLEFGRLEVKHSTIQLLLQCRPIHGHTLWLSAPQKLREGEEGELPQQLPGVKNLTLKFKSGKIHYLGATISSLLARCSNLEYLHLHNLIHPHYGRRCEEGCDDSNLQGSWKDNVISLAHLRVVKLGGFSGLECCFLDMVQLLLVSAPTLERMVVTANASIKGATRLMLVESLESSLPSGRGKWTARRAPNAAATSEYEWTQDLEPCHITE